MSINIAAELNKTAPTFDYMKRINLEHQLEDLYVQHRMDEITQQCHRVLGVPAKLQGKR